MTDIKNYLQKSWKCSYNGALYWRYVGLESRNLSTEIIYLFTEQWCMDIINLDYWVSRFYLLPVIVFFMCLIHVTPERACGFPRMRVVPHWPLEIIHTCMWVLWLICWNICVLQRQGPSSTLHYLVRDVRKVSRDTHSLYMCFPPHQRDWLACFVVVVK